MCNILAELVEEEKILEEDRKKTKKLVREVEGLKEEKKRNKERCNIESITADALERLLRDLNEDHVRKTQASEEKVKPMR